MTNGSKQSGPLRRPMDMIAPPTPNTPWLARAFFGLVLAGANTLLLVFVAQHYQATAYSVSCAAAVLVFALAVLLDIVQRPHLSYVALNVLAVATWCNFNIWAFSHLGNLMVLLGLYFFALFGLVLGSAIARLAWVLTDGRRDRLPLFNAIIVLAVWCGGLSLEASYFPNDAYNAYITRLRRLPPGETVEMATERIPRQAREHLSEHHGSDGVLGYVRWGCTKGSVEFDIPGRENRAGHRLSQRPFWFRVRLVMSLALLFFGVTAGCRIRQKLSRDSATPPDQTDS